MRDEVRPELSGLFEVLLEEGYAPAGTLPAALEEFYGGGLGLPRECVYANFVSSLDGITAVDPEAPGQGGLISGGLAADRFLMGLLRALADVVLVGAGTLRAEPRHRWTPARVYPPAGPAFAELRASLGLAKEPLLAVVTGSGHLDTSLPALAGGLVLTTAAGAGRIGGRPPAGIRVLDLGGGDRVPGSAVVQALRSEGLGRILTEGGPHLFGALLAENLVDQLFLTLAPVLAGRERSGKQVGLVEGSSLLPGDDRRSRLSGVRRSGSHLFLRYLLRD